MATDPTGLMQRPISLPPVLGGPQPGGQPPDQKDIENPPVQNGSQPDSEPPMQRDPQLPETVG